MGALDTQAPVVGRMFGGTFQLAEYACHTAALHHIHTTSHTAVWTGGLNQFIGYLVCSGCLLRHGIHLITRY